MTPNQAATNRARSDDARFAYLSNPKPCKNCNGPIPLFPGKSPGYSRKRHCCSDGCIQQAGSKGHLARDPFWTGLRECKQCGGEITTGSVRRHFCNASCRIAYFEEHNAALTEARRREWEAKPNCCLSCKEPIPYRVGWKLARMRQQRFCSHACSTYHHRRSIVKKVLPDGVCDHCRGPVAVTRKFCGMTCKKAARKARGYKPPSYTGKSRRMKAKAVEYKGGKCKGCGYDKCVRSLQFHHVDPKEKDFTVSDRAKRGISWELLCKELDKCLLLCANCHGEVHDGIRTVEFDPFFD